MICKRLRLVPLPAKLIKWNNVESKNQIPRGANDPQRKEREARTATMTDEN